MKNINVNLLKQMIADGYIVSQKHPTLDIYLFNYTRKCTYEKMWNDATLMARGLILDANYNIVSLPLGKFFNYEELTDEKKKTFENRKYRITEKVDGSCGVNFSFSDICGIATRGSFNSDQAIWATNLLNTKYADAIKKLNTKEYTYVFEIIFKRNQIVCKYDFEDIVLLAIINKYTGKDEWISDETKTFLTSLGFTIVKDFPELENKSFEELKAMNLPNKEGFVLQFENGERIKLKFEDYCRLHSIITNITARDIWETLKLNKPIDEILENVPDEFDEWVRNKIAFLKKQFSDVKSEIEKRHASVIAELPATYSKKWFAMKNMSLNKDRFFKGAVFAMEDGKDLTEKIWDAIYPTHEKPFSSKVEEDLE